jgi:hypothetical protein
MIVAKDEMNDAKPQSTELDTIVNKPRTLINRNALIIESVEVMYFW